MKEMHKKSLQMIKELQRIPTEEEWNSIAKEKCLMSYITLQYVENKKFHRLCKQIRRAG